VPVIDDITRLHHIHDAASKAIQFIKTKKRVELETNEMLGFALVRLMEIIGEAATGISEELKRKYPQIAWRQMWGMRNRLIHGCFEVNRDIIWETVTKELPSLTRQIKQVIDNESASSSPQVINRNEDNKQWKV
jgi:uncharacterized protein with HEPN domain